MRPSSHPDVSVIVVTWNRLSLLQACLKSLENQQDVAFEVIVVDNASADGTRTWLDTYSAGAPFPVRVIHNSENLGFCAANNQGFRVAQGRSFALLNNDAEASPAWLREMLAAGDVSPDTGMVASKILVWEDPRYIDKVGHLIFPDGQNRGRGTGELDRGQYDKTEEVLWPDGCACLYRRAMIEEIGGFDEDFFAYADDAELGLRARIAGWRCVYAPLAVVRHHRGSTLGAWSPRRIRLIERNRVLLAVKLFPVSLLWRNPFYFAARLAAGLIAALRGKGEIGRAGSLGARVGLAWALVQGDWDALKLVPAMWRKRQAVDALRKLSPRAVKELILGHRISVRDLSEQAIPEKAR